MMAGMASTGRVDLKKSSIGAKVSSAVLLLLVKPSTIAVASITASELVA